MWGTHYCVRWEQCLFLTDTSLKCVLHKQVMSRSSWIQASPKLQSQRITTWHIPSWWQSKVMLPTSFQSFRQQSQCRNGFAIGPKFSKVWGHVNTAWQVQIPPLVILQWESATMRSINTVRTITGSIITQQSFMKSVYFWTISGNRKIGLKSWVILSVRDKISDQMIRVNRLCSTTSRNAPFSVFLLQDSWWKKTALAAI